MKQQKKAKKEVVLRPQIVVCRNVTREYHTGSVTVQALRGLNLDIPQGEFVILLGPSGSGKSTAVNIIGGLDNPTSGQVMVQGEDISSYNSKKMTEFRRRKLGFVFQFYNLIPTLTAGPADAFIPEEHRAGVNELRREFVEYLKKEVVPGMGLGGNLPAMQVTADAKITPVANFRRGFDEKYKLVDEAAFKEITVGKKTCYLCPIACGVSTKANAGPFAGTELERIEYETVALNGPNCLQYDIGTVVKLGQLCNEVGIDTIAFGAITAFVMELSEKGLIDYKLAWGDGAGQVRLLELIARREGIGDPAL